MSFPIWGLSSCVRLALVARDSTSEVRSTADSNLWWTNGRESVGGGTRKQKLGAKKASASIARPPSKPLCHYHHHHHYYYYRDNRIELVLVVLFLTQSGHGSERPTSPTGHKDGETKGLKQIRGLSVLDDSGAVSYCLLETKPR